MNLDQEEKKKKEAEENSAKKKLTRKEKKALKKAEKARKEPPPETPNEEPDPVPEEEPPKSEEVEAKLDAAPVHEIPPPKYSTWEKISPPARRKKQISNMESGFREVLGLVQSMRNNQEVLLDAFQKLPEAVDSVKKLADHSAQQSDLLKAMNEQMGGDSSGDFTKTLSSMDKTTQLLLERAQRSEERLFGMLKQAQRRIAFMTLLVLLLFLGAVGAVMFIMFPEQTQLWIDKVNTPVEEVTEVTLPEDTEISTPLIKETDIPLEEEAAPPEISSEIVEPVPLENSVDEQTDEPTEITGEEIPVEEETTTVISSDTAPEEN